MRSCWQWRQWRAAPHRTVVQITTASTGHFLAGSLGAQKSMQMKTWTGDDGTTDPIRYPLDRKNYDDLIKANVLNPRILVLVTVPNKVEAWMEMSPDQLILRRCGYWVSLAGLPESENLESVTVSVSRANLLTAEALQRLMQEVNDRP